MTAVEREFVSLDSATGRRNGAGFRTCQGLYYKPPQSLPKVAFVANFNVFNKRRHFALKMLGKLINFNAQVSKLINSTSCQCDNASVGEGVKVLVFAGL